MKRVKTAVVGLNRGGVLAGHILHTAHSLELVAVCDKDRAKADKFALEHDVPAVYSSLEELLRTDVETVILATPIPEHAEHVVASLGAGKHVLSEVTSATTMEDCLRIAEAVRTAKGKYMMEENYCYYRPLTIVQNMIRAGLFGDIYYGESDYLMDFQLRPGFPDKLQPWWREVYFGRRGQYVRFDAPGEGRRNDPPPQQLCFVPSRSVYVLQRPGNEGLLSGTAGTGRFP